METRFTAPALLDGRSDLAGRQMSDLQFVPEAMTAVTLIAALTAEPARAAWTAARLDPPR